MATYAYARQSELSALKHMDIITTYCDGMSVEVMDSFFEELVSRVDSRLPEDMEWQPYISEVWAHTETDYTGFKKFLDEEYHGDFIRYFLDIVEEEFDNVDVIRELDHMPFDKAFDVDGHEELCHATGNEVKINDEWWNEFIDSNGEFHYGR